MPYPAKTSVDSIRQAALLIIERDGLGALSMRALAAELGLTASSLYRHYPDREALERTLADEGARLLHLELVRASDEREPDAPLEAIADGYLTFARMRPALYDLLVTPRPPTIAAPGAGKDLWNFLLRQVGRITGREDDTAAAVAVWSFLHGFISLERTGLFGASGPGGGLERGLAALQAGLENQSQPHKAS